MGQKIHIHKNIIDACKNGDERAKYELYKLYSKAMFNVCCRMMNSKEEAEDMLQETFVQMFSKLETFRFESSFGSWLKRITVNTCLNAINKKRVELTFCEAIFDGGIQNEPVENGTELSVARVTRAMEQLPKGARVIFSLYLFEGYDHGEIAQIMGITESTSKSQFMRAKRRVVEIVNNQKIRLS